MGQNSHLIVRFATKASSNVKWVLCTSVLYFWSKQENRTPDFELTIMSDPHYDMRTVTRCFSFWSIWYYQFHSQNHHAGFLFLPSVPLYHPELNYKLVQYDVSGKNSTYEIHLAALTFISDIACFWAITCLYLSFESL